MVVTNYTRGFALCAWLFFGAQSHAQVLPEDRVDALYHVYDGGGITVQGPSVLVRKSVADTVSVSANYYVDSISSASVDVVTLGASRYAEERTQLSGSIEYLYENSILSYAYTNSSENDYEAVTSNLSISQEMFGGLTTIALGFKSGNNVVKNSTDPSFEDATDIKGYRLSLSQVITKNMLLGSAYEIITDSGYLNNPYRQVRYSDSSQTLGYSFEPEVYPRSHTSNAVGFSVKYFLPYRASVSGGYRYYIDSWDIEADTFDVSYVHPIDDKWLFDATYRFYSQTSASFYNDLFPYQSAQTYLARDKELSTYNSHSIGLGVTYKLGHEQLVIFDKGTINLYYNLFMFSYDNFRDIPTGRDNNLMGGTEPLYDFNAHVIRFFLSAWF